MKTAFIFFLFVILFLSCEKNDDQLSELKGVWIEKSLRNDTIIFNSPEYNFGGNWFELRRGVMLSTGPYEYKLIEDSITVHWMLSSCTCWRTYYFKLNSFKNELGIGKFYDSEELEAEILLFERL
ncbi:MAG: hypothetical protein IH594_08270 [Bacteroidales bacterium]|nr:hypothetical protein [Bacteroidales bacterium]